MREYMIYLFISYLNTLTDEELFYFLVDLDFAFNDSYLDCTNFNCLDDDSSQHDCFNCCLSRFSCT